VKLTQPISMLCRGVECIELYFHASRVVHRHRGHFYCCCIFLCVTVCTFLDISEIHFILSPYLCLVPQEPFFHMIATVRTKRLVHFTLFRSVILTAVHVMKRFDITNPNFAGSLAHLGRSSRTDTVRSSGGAEAFRYNPL
jgi:hypothetical protein